MYKCAAIALLAITVSFVLCAESDHKNHAPEKRQDDSFLFFGGWRPITPGNPFYFGTSEGSYGELLGLKEDDKLDTSSTFFTSYPQTHYEKDIYSYYPRPAIKQRPKPNTPLYVESTSKRRRRPHKQPQSVPVEHEIALGEITTFPIPNLHGLKEAILSAQDFGPIDFPQNQRKNVEVVEVTVHPIQSEIANGGNGLAYGKSSVGRGLGQARNFPHFQIPRNIRKRPNFQRALSKSISHSPTLEEVIDVKNIQIVEVPVPPQLHRSIISLDKSHLNQRQNRHPSIRQSFVTAHRIAQEPVFGGRDSYFARPNSQIHQRGFLSGGEHQNLPQESHGVRDQPHISAELIKVSDDQIKSLLKSLQIVDKVSKDIYRYAPLSDHKKNKGDDIQLVVALPQKNVGSVVLGSDPDSGYDAGSQNFDIQVPGYGEYSNDARHSENYAVAKKEVVPSVEGLSNDYPVEEQREQSPSFPRERKRYHSEGHRQDPSTEEHQSSGYESGNLYKGIAASEEEYNKHENEEGKKQYGSYETVQHTNTYIEVNTHTGEDGYRREPILALELQEGQSVEDALKSLDAETLQKLGSHGKEGLEIQVVEMPGDEYTSESRKQMTVVARKNVTNTKL